MRVPSLGRGSVIALIAVVVVVAVPSEYSFGRRASPLGVVMDLLVAVGFAAAGLLAWVKRPHVPIGAMIYAIGLLWLFPGFRYGGIPAWLSTVGWCVQFGFIFFGAVLVGFPTGRITARVDRLLMAVLIASQTVGNWIQLPFLVPADFPDGPQGENLLAFAPNRSVAGMLGQVNGRVALALALAFLARVVWRVIRATPPARHVLMPVVGAAAGSLVGLVLVLVGAIPVVLYNGFLLLIPLGLLGGVLRTRVTRSGVGDLVVALGHGVSPPELRDLLAHALGDPSLQLAFVAGDALVDADGRAVDAVEGRAMTTLGDAVLIHDPAVLHDDGLIDAVGAAARLALDNARLQAQVRAQLEEVRASRQRIVEAADAERRRIERNLHDGAQQRLLSLTLELTKLRGQVGGADVDDRLASVIDEARRTLAEVRELARGIHPPVLTNDGLASALETLAERAPIPVHLDISLSQRLPEPVEAAAWYLASEALTNVIRHSGATEAWVSAQECDDEVAVIVRDNGCGTAAFVSGRGLAGLRDRLEALDGELVVNGDQGGTQVIGRLPCAIDASSSKP